MAEPISTPAEAAPAEALPVSRKKLPVWIWSVIVVAALVLVVGGGLFITRVVFPPGAGGPSPTSAAELGVTATPTSLSVAASGSVTPVPPTPTPTQPASTPTTTAVPPTSTSTVVPPAATPTAAPPTSTAAPPTTAPPTSTAAPPTATPSPTSHLLPAPALIAPPDGTSFAGWNAEVVLQWESVGSLAQDEYHVIRIPYDSAGGVAEFWRQETSFRVPQNFSLANVGFADRHYNWSVQVMRCTARCETLDDGVRKEGVAAGDESAEGLFYWHPDVGGGQTPGPGETTPTPAS